MFKRGAWWVTGALAACLAIAGGMRGAAAHGKIEALTHAYNVSGQELFGKLAAEPGNIVISPYSIGAAMAMALTGASGENAEEMVGVLKHRLRQGEIGEANKEALAILRAYDRGAEGPSCPEGMQLLEGRCVSGVQPNGLCPRFAGRDGERCFAFPQRQSSARFVVANALMITPDGKRAIFKDYVERVQNQFDGEVFQDAGLPEVNGWVSRKTEGKIPKILDELDPHALAVLLNAVHFKAAWAHPFKKQLTRDAPFHLSAKESVDVPTMNQLLRIPYFEAPGYRAIRLPFSAEELGLVVVLPGEGAGIGEVSARLAAGGLSELLTGLSGSTATVELSLPRFKAAYRAGLIPHFRSAGMNKAFEFGSGFSKMLSGEVAITQIEHRAVIEANEEGCEASAATAVTIAERSARIEHPETFRADRPFLFYLQDNTTGAILFQGRIADPRGG